MRSIQYGHAYGSDTKNGELCPNIELTGWGFDIVRRDGVFKVDQMNTLLTGYSKEEQEKINDLLRLDKLSLALYILTLEKWTIKIESK